MNGQSGNFFRGIANIVEGERATTKHPDDGKAGPPGAPRDEIGSILDDPPSESLCKLDRLGEISIPCHKVRYAGLVAASRCFSRSRCGNGQPPRPPP